MHRLNSVRWSADSSLLLLLIWHVLLRLHKRGEKRERERLKFHFRPWCELFGDYIDIYIYSIHFDRASTATKMSSKGRNTTKSCNLFIEFIRRKQTQIYIVSHIFVLCRWRFCCCNAIAVEMLHAYRLNILPISEWLSFYWEYITILCWNFSLSLPLSLPLFSDCSVDLSLRGSQLIHSHRKFSCCKSIVHSFYFSL